MEKKETFWRIGPIITILLVSVLSACVFQDSEDRVNDPNYEENQFESLRPQEGESVRCDYGIIINIRTRTEESWCEVVGWVRCYLVSEDETRNELAIYTAIIKKYIERDLGETCPFQRKVALDRIRDLVEENTGVEPSMNPVRLIDYPEDIILLIKEVDYERIEKI